MSELITDQATDEVEALMRLYDKPNSFLVLKGQSMGKTECMPVIVGSLEPDKPIKGRIIMAVEETYGVELTHSANLAELQRLRDEMNRLRRALARLGPDEYFRIGDELHRQRVVAFDAAEHERAQVEQAESQAIGHALGVMRRNATR
jgi:hypothetical protein